MADINLESQTPVAIGANDAAIVRRGTGGVNSGPFSAELVQLGSLATQSGTFSGTSSGTNTGDQTITLTGVVTGSGTGSFATSLGSFTKAQLDAAVSDGNVMYVGDAPTAHTHTASEVTDFSEAVDDRVSALLVAGSNVTLTYNDVANTLTVAASGGGGGSGATGGSATLDFGAAPGSSLAEVVVTGQTGLLSGSRIRAWVQGSTADHNAYEHSRILPGRIGLGTADVVAGTGFTICAETELRLTGEVAVNWEWA